MNWRYLVFRLTLFVIISECSTCFIGNQNHEYRLKTGSSFYMECRCDERPPSVVILKWFGPNDKEIMPPGPGTKSNVYTEWWDDLTNSLYITHMSKSSSGEYKCFTVYNETHYVHTYDVQAYEAPYFINTKETQYVINGSDALITCEAKGDINPLISWHKDNFEPIEITDDNKYEISSEGLLIHNISIEDNGVYKCVAADYETGEEVAIDIKVEVVTMPEIVELVAVPENIAYEGASISMECIASGTPPPEYSWKKIYKNAHVDGKPNYKQTLNKIEFENVDKNDTGIYECTASNTAGNVSKQIRLNVLVPPKITQFKNATAVEDGTVQLVCRAEGIPVPQINVAFFGESDDLSIVWDSKVISDTETEMYLSFLRVNRSHEGSYICNATNDADSVTAEMYLTVFYKPVFKEPIENVWGWNGNTVNLTCDQESNPPANITWRYESRDISTEEQLEINRIILNNNNVPVIFENDTMYGVYECIAKNEYGTAKKVVVFLEGFAPPPIRNAIVMNITSTSVIFAIVGPEQINGPPVVGFTSEYDLLNNYNITDIHINRTWSIDRPYKINKLKPNSSYLIKFAAVNDVGAGSWSNYLEFVTLEKSSPEEPTWSTDIESIKNGILKWKVGEDNGEQIDYYVIRYCPVVYLAIQNNECIEETLDPTNEFYLNNLEGNMTYYFELVAHNVLGNSSIASTYITLPEREPGALTAGSTLGIVLVAVFLGLILLDFLLLVLKKKGVIASCIHKKDKKTETINARDRKGLLRENTEIGRSSDGPKEFEYNKNTGVVTGKHSAV
ncbi:fasciclin-2-like isoform X2 [Pieris napi]|uniref:fasciclin-2-like isoform X2 n=1 Tax=Pieris napi TaxID=78633 RepID=UPI001FB9382A|nr:fasciclin-2-like isoform X2 [Pieris napi]